MPQSHECDCNLLLKMKNRSKAVQFICSVVSDSLRPHEPKHARPPCPSPSPPKPMSIVSVMPSNHLILCHPLLLLPSIFPSIRGFSNESALCIRWPKYWSFSFNIELVKTECEKRSAGKERCDPCISLKAQLVGDVIHSCPPTLIQAH